jgi:hypothetical protein
VESIKDINGLGDVVAKVAKMTSINKVVKFVTKVTGKSDCGCKKRQDALNKKFPFKNK